MMGWPGGPRLSRCGHSQGSWGSALPPRLLTSLPPRGRCILPSRHMVTFPPALPLLLGRGLGPAWDAASRWARVALGPPMSSLHEAPAPPTPRSGRTCSALHTLADPTSPSDAVPDPSRWGPRLDPEVTVHHPCLEAGFSSGPGALGARAVAGGRLTLLLRPDQSVWLLLSHFSRVRLCVTP